MRNRLLLLILAALILLPSVYAASPYFFSGYAHVNGSLAPNGTVVEVRVAGVNNYNVTIGHDILANKPAGWYLISFEANSGDNVTFQLNGLPLLNINGTNNATQILTSSNIVESFNLSANKTANSAACEISLACTSGFCTHSICRSGDPFCGDSFCDSGESCSADDSACGSGSACTNGCVATSTASTGGGGGSSGGGGGGGLPSQTLPSVSVSANEPRAITVTEKALPVNEVAITTTVTTAIQITVKEVSKPSSVSFVISSDTGKVYKYVDITQKGTDADKIKKATIKFKIPKTWFTQNSIEPATVALNRLVGSSWVKLSTKQTTSDSMNIIYEADTEGFSVFAITGENAAAQPAFAQCGNGIVETGEDCDGSNLAGATCQSLGYETGELSCSSCKYDTSACTSAEEIVPPLPATPAGEGPPSAVPGRIDPAVIAGVIILILLVAAYAVWYRRKRVPR